MAETREFGAALRAAREDAGLSLKRAAEMIGLSHNALGNWELGKRKKRLPRARVEQLEKIYGIDDQRLLIAGGYLHRPTPPPATPGRQSLSYGGSALTPTEETEVLSYIDYLRSKRRPG